jgi:hypothetical protein
MSLSRVPVNLNGTLRSGFGKNYTGVLKVEKKAI